MCLYNHGHHNADATRLHSALNAARQAFETYVCARMTMSMVAMQVLEDYTEPMNSVRQAFEDLQECIHRDFPMPQTPQASIVTI